MIEKQNEEIKALRQQLCDAQSAVQEQKAKNRKLLNQNVQLYDHIQRFQK